MFRRVAIDLPRNARKSRTALHTRMLPRDHRLRLKLVAITKGWKRVLRLNWVGNFSLNVTSFGVYRWNLTTLRVMQFSLRSNS